MLTRIGRHDKFNCSPLLRRMQSLAETPQFHPELDRTHPKACFKSLRSKQKTARLPPDRLCHFADSKATKLACDLPNIIIFGFFLLALLGRLEGHFGVLGTIRTAIGLATTKREFRIRWIANRPFAHAVAQGQDGRRFAVRQWLRCQCVSIAAFSVCFRSASATTRCGFGVTTVPSGCTRGFGRARRGGRFTGRDGVARPDSPRRCTLPITALRVTPPSSLAIWLAE